MINRKDYIIPSTFIALTALSGLLLSAPNSYADSSAGVDLSVTIPSACSLTITQDTLSTTIIPGNNGTIGTSTIQSICNDPAGLAVYAVGYTNDSYGNNTLTSTVGSNTYSIASHATTSGTPNNSEWNMTLTPVTGTYAPEIVTGYSQAHEVPNQYTKVAYRNAMTDMGTNATGAKFTATFNAYIANTQAAGTYTGKVKFLLVHPNVLTWQEDSQNPGTMIPDTVQPATFAMDPETIIGDCSPNSPLLQNVSSWGSSVALGETIDAIDSRDNQCYKVKRLKMNSAGTETALWMSNLNLGAEPLTVSTLDSTNTNLPSSGNSDVDVATTFNSWIKSSGTGSFTEPELIPITASNSATSSATDTYGNKYGTLYNYAAASAGTYTYDNNSGTGNAISDLCPSGWRMPTGNTTGEYTNVYYAYSLTADAQSVIAIQENMGFSLAGFSNSSTPDYQGSYGYYWSSTFCDSFTMYANTISSSFINHVGSLPRNIGFSVRCIAQ